MEWFGWLAVNVIWVAADKGVDEAGGVAKVAVENCFPCTLRNLINFFRVACDGACEPAVWGVGVKFECGEGPRVLVVEDGA